MERKLKTTFYKDIVEAMGIFIKGVRKAQKENKKHGLPNVYVYNNKIYYQLPNGEITTKAPPCLKKYSS